MRALFWPHWPYYIKKFMIKRLIMPYLSRTLFVFRHGIGVLMCVGIMIGASHLSVDIGPVPCTLQK